MKLPDTLQVMDHLYIKHLEFKKKKPRLITFLMKHYLLILGNIFYTLQNSVIYRISFYPQDNLLSQGGKLKFKEVIGLNKCLLGPSFPCKSTGVSYLGYIIYITSCQHSKWF